MPESAEPISAEDHIGQLESLRFPSIIGRGAVKGGLSERSAEDKRRN